MELTLDVIASKSGPEVTSSAVPVAAKYGLMLPIMRLVDGVRHLGKGPFPDANTGVVITPIAAATVVGISSRHLARLAG